MLSVGRTRATSAARNPGSTQRKAAGSLMTGGFAMSCSSEAQPFGAAKQ